MTTILRPRTLPLLLAGALTLALAGPSHGAPPAAASRPASAAAASAPRAASAPGLGLRPDGTPRRMPLAPHVGIPGAERLGVTDRPARPATMVDINSATVAELKTLPGVGDAEAQRIVAGRPYRVKTDLVSKKVMLEGPFMSLRHHVTAVPPPGALGAGKIKPDNKSGNAATARPAASAVRPAAGKS